MIILKVNVFAKETDPYYFRWDNNGNQVSSVAFCSGHPKGGNNLCGFYTTTPADDGRVRCISTGPCNGTRVDYGVFCLRRTW
jgi:hypothetical protein